MFTKAQTRVLLVLSLLITAGASFIALNWDRETEEEREVKQVLEVPEIETPGLRRPAPAEEPEEEPRERVIDLDEEEEDTGRTIDLY